MGTCLSKKNGSSTSPNKSVSQHRNSENSVTVTLSKPTEPEVSLKKTLQEKQQQGPESAPQDELGEVKKEIFIIKHRKSHDDREKTTTSKTPPCIAPQQGGDGVFTNEEPMVNKIAPSTPMGVGVRTSSCTKEEVDAILIQCGRLSRSSSGRKYSGSKRSFDFDHCDNDTTSAEDDQRRAKGNGREENDGAAAASESRRHRQSPRRSQGRRRTPSRERDQSNGRERRVSRSPGRRSSDTTTAANASSSNNNSTSSRPGKMVSVPATISSLVMDKSNNNCGGESGTKRITVKRNVGDAGSRGAASPRAQSPARVNGNVARDKVLSENQQHQQPSLSRNNSSRKAEQSPYRRNPLSEVDHNNSSRKAEQSPYRRNPLSEVDTNSKVQQNKPKNEAETIQKPNGRVALEKGVSVNCKTKEQHEEESSVPVSAVVKTTVVSSGVDNLKPQGLTRSRSSRKSRDLDINPEAVVNPTHSYASLLLEDIQNFHQKTTPPQQQQPSSISLPACLTKACSILEAVADLNSTTSSNFSGGAFSEDRRSPSTQQSIRNEYYGKKVPGAKDPFVESEVAVSDDVMEPSLHKYVTVKRGGGVVEDMEDQESSGSNSFTVSSSGQHHWGNISSSSWEPNSADSTDCWTSSRLSSREEGQKTPLGLGCSLSSEAKKKGLNSKKRECDHEHSSGIGRGRLGSNKGVCV